MNLKKLEEYQSVEKAGLITGGIVFISVGVELIEKDRLAGIIMLILGSVCVVVRELIKLRK